MRPTIDAAFQRLWYGNSRMALFLMPLAWIFAFLSASRRGLYRVGALRSVRVDKPVIVVGNITVGGTGKTPLVIWLAGALRDRGFVPGIVTRGYGGQSVWPCDVSADSDATAVGDEAVLLAERTGAIVIAGPDRVQAAQRAIDRGASVVISDDGLQHYRLQRDFEIAVVDEERRFGNGLRLPAGPLRESVRRLAEVDALICNNRGAQRNPAAPLNHPLSLRMNSCIAAARAIVSGATRPLSAFVGQTVHAVAGIGNSQAFFTALFALGLDVRSHPLRDHARITAADLDFGDGACVLMTEKDAVKCRGFADGRLWAVPLEVQIEGADSLLNAVASRLDSAGQPAHSRKISITD